MPALSQGPVSCWLGMHVAFVSGVCGWFELERGVLEGDGEVVRGAGLERVEHVGDVSVVEAFVLDDDVRGEDRQ